MEQPPEILCSGEVELRRLCVSDLEPLYRVITESIDHLLPWLPWAASHDRQQVEEYLARSVEGWTAGQAYQYAISSGGAVIGSCGLMRRIGPGGLDIGYWLHPAWTGKGLATAAVAALAEAATGLAGIERLEIRHDEANRASGAVARRLGFTRVKRAQVPEGPTAAGEVGVEVIWRLDTRTATVG